MVNESTMVQALIEYGFVEHLLHARLCAGAEDRAETKADVSPAPSCSFLVIYLEIGFIQSFLRFLLFLSRSQIFLIEITYLQ